MSNSEYYAHGALSATSTDKGGRQRPNEVVDDIEQMQDEFADGNTISNFVRT